MLLSKNKKANAIADKLMKRTASDKKDNASTSTSSDATTEDTRTSSTEIASAPAPQDPKGGVDSDIHNEGAQATTSDKPVEHATTSSAEEPPGLSVVDEKKESEQERNPESSNGASTSSSPIRTPPSERTSPKYPTMTANQVTMIPLTDLQKVSEIKAAHERQASQERQARLRQKLMAQPKDTHLLVEDKNKYLSKRKKNHKPVQKIERGRKARRSPGSSPKTSKSNSSVSSTDDLSDDQAMDWEHTGTTELVETLVALEPKAYDDASRGLDDADSSTNSVDGSGAQQLPTQDLPSSENLNTTKDGLSSDDKLQSPSENTVDDHLHVATVDNHAQVSMKNEEATSDGLQTILKNTTSGHDLKEQDGTVNMPDGPEIKPDEKDTPLAFVATADRHEDTMTEQEPTFGDRLKSQLEDAGANEGYVEDDGTSASRTDEVKSEEVNTHDESSTHSDHLEGIVKVEDAVLSTPTTPLGLLQLPNSDGKTHFESREMAEKLIAMHIRPLVFTPAQHKSTKKVTNKVTYPQLVVQETMPTKPETENHQKGSQVLTQTPNPEQVLENRELAVADELQEVYDKSDATISSAASTDFETTSIHDGMRSSPKPKDLDENLVSHRQTIVPDSMEATNESHVTGPSTELVELFVPEGKVSESEENEATLPSFPGAILDFDRPHNEFQMFQENRFSLGMTGLAILEDTKENVIDETLKFERRSIAPEESSSNLGHSKDRALSPANTTATIPRTSSSIEAAAQEARKLWELQNTFLVDSIVCLQDFVELLDFDPSTGAVNKQAIMDVFAHLAQYERDEVNKENLIPSSEYTISRSPSPFNIKLGRVSLRKFLNEIPFDSQGSTSVMKVGKAFRKLSNPGNVSSPLSSTSTFLQLEAFAED